jgi:methyl-accepting chemotaxis protein
MDPTSDVQTEILRDIWKQLVALDRNLSNRIDQTNGRLDQTNGRLEEVAATLTAFMEQTQSNFARVQRNFESVQRNFETVQHNFERVDERFVEAATDRERSRDVDARLTRLEVHTGLRDA